MERILAADTVKFIGEQVKVAGWVASIRDHGQLIFIDLRDWSGRVQLVVSPDNKELFEKAKELGAEYVIEVEGSVNERTSDLKNEKIETGSIEIPVSKLNILNKSKTIPFPIDGDGREIDESMRLKYRYIDMRRDRIKNIMMQKHRLLLETRKWMDKNGFTEVITPLLTSTSPEGARDYIVPSRIHKGLSFVLPQAPQQYKQLLMVGGVDKYFQIAPCARDEDPRADRHAGIFYQIDVEMSFPTIDKIFSTCENLIKDTYQAISPEKTIKEFPFSRISHHDALNTYGSDKPDVRFDMKIQDISEVVKGKTEFNVFNSAEVVKCLVVKGKADLSRKEIEELEDFAKKHGAKGLAYTKVVKNSFDSGIAKFIEPVAEEIINKVNAEEGDLILFGADVNDVVNKVLGQVRLKLGADLNLVDEKVLAFTWVTDFPFYEINEETGKLDFGHNPFSMPKGGLEAFDVEDPLEIETNQYDLALNGYEILSGSIRNHDPEVLLKAFEVVGYGEEEVKNRFGGMYNAFQYGAPPHGGWAIGLDRYLMILIDEPNIRDVYAFPKNSNGMDLLMNAPSRIPEADLEAVGIEHIEKGNKTLESIEKLLKEHEVDYKKIEHEAVRTSEEAAKVRGTKVADATKALILKSTEYMNKHFMVVIPADKQLDIEKASEIIGEKVVLAKGAEVEKRFGIKMGGVPPFGRVLGIEVYFDKEIWNKTESVFNAGRQDISIIMPTEKLIELAEPNKVSATTSFI